MVDAYEIDHGRKRGCLKHVKYEKGTKLSIRKEKRQWNQMWMVKTMINLVKTWKVKEFES